MSLLFKITNQRVSKLNFLMYFFLATSIRTFDRTLVRSCEPAQPSPPVWFSGWTLEESTPKTPVHNPAPSEVPSPSYLSVLDCQRMNGFLARKFILRITVLILSGNDVFGNLEVIEHQRQLQQQQQQGDQPQEEAHLWNSKSSAPTQLKEIPENQTPVE